MDATSPTPCIDYISTITNRIVVQFSVYTSDEKSRDIREKSVKIEERENQKIDVFLLVGDFLTAFYIFKE